MKSFILIWYVLIHHANAYRNGQTDYRSAVDRPSPGSTTDNYFNREQEIKKETCLTGHMTDTQQWVNEVGVLTAHKIGSIDLTGRADPVLSLMQEIRGVRESNYVPVKYLSLSRCNLTRVPTIFRIKDVRGKSLSATVEYMTLYGNNFTDVSTPGRQYGESMNASNAEAFEFLIARPAQSTWAFGFNQVTFESLKELDLRKCSIKLLTDNVFTNMPNLEALYLGENNIAYISADSFFGLKKLLHLDLSRNMEKKGKSLALENVGVFRRLENLKSLDLSKTQLQQKDNNMLRGLSEKLERLSLCYTGLTMLPSRIFNHTRLKYLDVSGNNGIMSANNPLGGLEDSLQVVYAKEVGMKSLHPFKELKEIQVIDLEGNEVGSGPMHIGRFWHILAVLNLDRNRVTTWFKILFRPLKSLSLLSLRDNNINMLSHEMLDDFENITYIGLSGNFFVCNCRSRELFELAYHNQNRTNEQPLLSKSRGRFAFHTAYNDFNSLVAERKEIIRHCDGNCLFPLNTDTLESEGHFQLFDYDEDAYKCLLLTEAKSVPFLDVNSCNQSKREGDLEKVFERRINLLYLLLIIPIVLLPVLIFCYVFRKSVKYFCITIRNSATLSLLNKNHLVDDGTIFNYDVFVSYCNDDRNWVLDHLLPHVENDCNVSVCLHERDFMVGLSILENIVSCMDRSRYIMLIISQQFLLSQWCQFEMHLAQHRLLETRREDLILVLLEEIPRSLRPTTLHYLMLTKTYIVWPKHDADQPAFWRRLKRSLLAYKIPGRENISTV